MCQRHAGAGWAFGNTFFISAVVLQDLKKRMDSLRWWGRRASVGNRVTAWPATANPLFWCFANLLIIFCPDKRLSQRSMRFAFTPGELRINGCNDVDIEKFWTQWNVLRRSGAEKVTENTTYAIYHRYPQDGPEMGFGYKSVNNSPIIDSWNHHLYN